MTATRTKPVRKPSKREANRASYVESVQGLQLLGNVITFTALEEEYPYARVVESLSAAGLDAKAAKEMLPRNAFTRASKVLSEERIIRKVKEDDTHLYFQFTREALSGDKWQYQFETVLSLNKESGDVGCDIAELSAKAQAELHRCIASRTKSDVNSIVRRLFDAEADLFNIPDARGVYVVPQEHTAFLEKVEQFMAIIHGRVNRVPIPKGTGHGEKTVKEAVEGGLANLIQDLTKAVETFGTDTRESTLEHHAKRIQQAKHKIEVYAQYLADAKDGLEDAVADAQEKLKVRVAGIGMANVAAEDDDCFLVACDHCGAPHPVADTTIKTLVCRECKQAFRVEFEEEEPEANEWDDEEAVA